LRFLDFEISGIRDFWIISAFLDIIFYFYFDIFHSYFKDEDPLIEFYKARVGYFYSGVVDPVNFDQLDTEVRSSTNQMINMKTVGQVPDFMYHDHLPAYAPPMISFAANYLEVKLKKNLTLL
jgi:hypothetical protein